MFRGIVHQIYMPSMCKTLKVNDIAQKGQPKKKKKVLQVSEKLFYVDF